MFLQIPEQYKLGVRKIATATDDVIDAVMSAMRELPLVLRIAGQAVDAAVKTGKIEEHDALDIILPIVGLYALSEEENLSTEEIVDSISASIDEDDDFIISKKDLDRLRERLTNLLNVNSNIKIAQKASKLLSEHERLFMEAEFLTDIRPVFDSNIESKINATVVVHTDEN